MNREEAEKAVEALTQAVGDWSAVEQMRSTDGWAFISQRLAKKRAGLLKALAREEDTTKLRMAQGQVIAIDEILAPIEAAHLVRARNAKLAAELEAKLSA